IPSLHVTSVLQRNFALSPWIEVIERGYRSLHRFIPFVTVFVINFVVIGKIRFAYFHFPLLLFSLVHWIDMQELIKYYHFACFLVKHIPHFARNFYQIIIAGIILYLASGFN